MKMSVEEELKLMQLKIDVIKVPPIRLPSELTKEEREEFEASIRQDGIMNPIQVVEDHQNNLWLMDGGNRLEVARKLGHERVLAVVRRGTVEDAVVGSAIINLKRGKVNPGLLAELVKYLVDELDWTLEKVAERLHLSKSYVSKLYRIAQDKSALNDLKARKLTVDEAYERVKSAEEGGLAHSFVTKLCSSTLTACEDSTTKLGLNDEDVKGLIKNTEPSTAGGRSLRRTEYTLCGWCGKPVRKELNVAQPIWIHIDEYDKALQALAKAKEEEDQAGVGPQSPQLEGSEAA
jgi:ParB/RepB/Spo0J family partition protein